MLLDPVTFFLSPPEEGNYDSPLLEAGYLCRMAIPGTLGDLLRYQATEKSAVMNGGIAVR